jgi:PadR family transcriptional regulator PadR
MRRKPGTLVPLEQAICIAARTLGSRGIKTFHGFLLAKELAALADARQLTAHGTLYRALGRLEKMGLLSSDWEDPQIAADEGRPRRRLYKITEDGLRAAASVDAASRSGGRRLVKA